MFHCIRLPYRYRHSNKKSHRTNSRIRIKIHKLKRTTRVKDRNTVGEGVVGMVIDWTPLKRWPTKGIVEAIGYLVDRNLLGCHLGGRSGEGDGQKTVLHVGFDLVLLKSYVSALPLKSSICKNCSLPLHPEEAVVSSRTCRTASRGQHSPSRRAQ